MELANETHSGSLCVSFPEGGQGQLATLSNGQLLARGVDHWRLLIKRFGMPIYLMKVLWEGVHVRCASFSAVLSSSARFLTRVCFRSFKWVTSQPSSHRIGVYYVKHLPMQTDAHNGVCLGVTGTLKEKGREWPPDVGFVWQDIRATNYSSMWFQQLCSQARSRSPPRGS